MRAVMQLFVKASSAYRDNNVVLEAVAIPCLGRILSVIEQGKYELGQGALRDGLRTVVASPESEVFTSLRDWLKAAPQHSYANWYRLQMTQTLSLPAAKEPPGAGPPKPAGGVRRTAARGEKRRSGAREGSESAGAVRRRFLEEKFGIRWRRACLRRLADKLGASGHREQPLNWSSALEPHDGWLRKMLFTPGSPVTRRTVCKTVTSLCAGHVTRIHWLLALLVEAMRDVRLDGGEHAAEYVALFTEFIKVRRGEGKVRSGEGW